MQKSIRSHLVHSLCRTPYNLADVDVYRATAMSVRDRLIDNWLDTNQYYTEHSGKRVYYLSLEYLLGRSLTNSVSNMELEGPLAEALMELGYDLENLSQMEKDAALGNGGLGRLAACFLDSMATMNIPGWGYGLRYNYGIFRQILRDGYQAEIPDYWLNYGNPWEIDNAEVFYGIRFGGHVNVTGDGRRVWEGGEVVQAVACDYPIPGFKTRNTNNLRLWRSRPGDEFNLDSFNQGDYLGACEDRQSAENISSVLYPADNTQQGKTLRLKQEYFFTAASLRDILRRYRKKGQLEKMSDFVVIQLNDTHPALAIPEMMRLLMDEEGFGWEEAWAISSKCFAFTNHTVLPEALEKWNVDLLHEVLPRHMEIIYEINHRFLEVVRAKFPGQTDMVQRMSIIEEGGGKRVRMANLAIVGSFTVNGVAALHSQLLIETIFRDFHALWPEKFQNKTNGVTPRRWILQCNKPLSDILNKWLETSEWPSKLELLSGLRQHIGHPELQREWSSMKLQAKKKLAAYIEKELGIKVDCNAMFDMHCKRIHEYKRQLLNILSVIHRYLQLKKMSAAERKEQVGRVVIFSGKAAPAYYMAKLIIKLITAVGDVVNVDADIGDKLKVVFIPNYSVSLAEIIIPACDLSQHISTAGTEASGTSNMKFAMNGGLIVGTLDGANIEIREEIGTENMFIFGARSHEIEHLRSENRLGRLKIPRSLRVVLEAINGGMFGEAHIFQPILDSILQNNDVYLVTADFASYLEVQDRIDTTWKDKASWNRMCMLSVAGSGKFSSDRTIAEYANDIWKVKPARVPKEWNTSDAIRNALQKK